MNYKYIKYNYKYWVFFGLMFCVWVGLVIVCCFSVILELVYGRLCCKNLGFLGEIFNVFCVFWIGECIYWGSLINFRLIDCKLFFEVRYLI